MPTRLSLGHSLAASATSLALAALLTDPAHAGGPLAYQFTDITNAQLGAASSRTVGISNTGVVAGIYDINGPGKLPFTAYLYDTHGHTIRTARRSRTLIITRKAAGRSLTPSAVPAT